MKGVLIKSVMLNDNLTDILIEGDSIKKIQPNIQLEQQDKNRYTIINGNNKVVLPGFINMHTHSAMTLMR